MDDELALRLIDLEVSVDDAVRAWTGAYPIFGGSTNWGMLLTRHRILSLTDGEVTLWAGYFMPSRGQAIQAAPVALLRLVKDRPVGYDKWQLEDTVVYVDTRDRAVVNSWLAATTSARRETFNPTVMHRRRDRIRRKFRSDPNAQ